jgi:phage tail-like protein
VSGRGLVEGLASPHPIGSALPALYQQEPFVQRFVSGFDDALAPVFCTLDNFAAYLDPALAPADFLAWLGAWLGVALDESSSRSQQRRLLERAGDLYRWRGTTRGLSELIELTTGVVPEIVESGGVTWSAGPDQPASSPADPLLVVRVRMPAEAGDGVDRRRLEALVAAARPAHVPFRVEVTG